MKRTTAAPLNDADRRYRLARMIIVASILSIGTASGLAIGLASDRGQTTQLVFSAVLPVLGTWVGTVLAFYFARDNLQAATDSTLRLTGRTDPRTPVTQVMVPRERMTARTLAPGGNPADLALTDLAGAMAAAAVKRVPILTATGAVAYLVHQSTLDSFAQAHGSQLSGTLADLVADPTLGPPVKALGFVGPHAVVAEARAALRAVDQCNDVFVTTSGQSADPVLGWLTNTDLAEND